MKRSAEKELKTTMAPPTKVHKTAKTPTASTSAEDASSLTPSPAIPTFVRPALDAFLANPAAKLSRDSAIVLTSLGMLDHTHAQRVACAAQLHNLRALTAEEFVNSYSTVPHTEPSVKLLLKWIPAHFAQVHSAPYYVMEEKSFAVRSLLCHFKHGEEAWRAFMEAELKHLTIWNWFCVNSHKIKFPDRKDY